MSTMKMPWELLEIEAREFFAASNEQDRAEARAFQLASLRSVVRDQRPEHQGT